MANLQYIGPRVVPKPYRNPDTGDASWKSGIAYEALMMVTYNGNGYVSAVPVPPSVGNPADNPDYWVESADFDAALSDLQTRVNNLEDQIDKIDDKYYLLIGDSYSINYNSVEGWMNKFETIMGLNSSNCFKYGHSGYGFLGQNGNQMYSTLLGNAYSDLGDAAANITDVIVLGGRNDIENNATPSELKTAIDNFVTQCATQFPNAKLYIGMCGMYKGNDTGKISKMYNLENLYYMSKGKNLAYIKGLQHIGRMAKNMMNDNDHPNDIGNEMIVKNVISILKGGSLSAASEYALGINLAVVDSHTNTGDVYYIQDNEGNIQLFANLIVGVSDITIVKEQAVGLVELTDIPLKGVGNNVHYNIDLNLRVRYLDGNNVQQYTVLPAKMCMLNGIIYVYFYGEFDYYNTIDYIMFQGAVQLPYRSV